VHTARRLASGVASRSFRVVRYLRSLFSRRAVRGRPRSRVRRGHGEAADRLWELLRSRELREWRFRRQHPLGPFVVDFVCIEQALVIELKAERSTPRDEARGLFLERLGYRVLRLADHEVLGDLKAVRLAITRRLHKWG
jgi:very-short-patch-repair endonuclease